MIFFGYQLHKKPFCQHSVVSADGELVSTVDLDLHRPSMMHDFAVTSKYSIVMDLPLRFDGRRGLTGSGLLYFNSGEISRFGILPRFAKSAGDVMWFRASTCYVFHTACAWEHDNKVGFCVVD